MIGTLPFSSYTFPVMKIGNSVSWSSLNTYKNPHFNVNFALGYGACSVHIVWNDVENNNNIEEEEQLLFFPTTF